MDPKTLAMLLQRYQQGGTSSFPKGNQSQMSNVPMNVMPPSMPQGPQYQKPWMGHGMGWSAPGITRAAPQAPMTMRRGYTL